MAVCAPRFPLGHDKGVYAKPSYQISHTEPLEQWCSMQSGDEPLPGTAAHQRRWVLLEHPGAWSHDILDGAAFGEELTAQLRAHLRAAGARLLLIRHPGRAGQYVARRRVYLVDSAPTQRSVRTVEVDQPSDLLRLDLRTGAVRADAPEPDHDGAAPSEPRVVDAPVVAVCTHGKRDKCCAVRGRPIAARLDADLGPELAAADPDAAVWECSHTGGHRFAPVMLLFSGGLTYGSSITDDYLDAVRAALRGKVWLYGYRGRSAFLPTEQVAEVAVRTMLDSQQSPADDDRHRHLTDIDCLVAAQHDGDIDPTRATVDVRHVDGRHWVVDLRWRDLPSRPASCGAAPKAAGTWDVVEIAPQN